MLSRRSTLLLLLFGLAVVNAEADSDVEHTTDSTNISYSEEKSNSTKNVTEVKVTRRYEHHRDPDKIGMHNLLGPRVYQRLRDHHRDYFGVNPWDLRLGYDSYGDSVFLESLPESDSFSLPDSLYTDSEEEVLKEVEVESMPLEDIEEANRDFCLHAKLDDDISEHGGRHPKFEEVSGVGFYRFHAKPRTWEDARRVCEGEGAHLVIINSEEEAKALLDIHNRCPDIISSHFNSYSYVGVHDIHSEGDFQTVYGEPLNETGYVKWANNQPDNAHHFGENCISMNRAGYYNDVPCYTKLPFFCEHI